MAEHPPRRPNLDLRIGHEELVIRDRYEVVSILNDVLIAVFFIVGSILFFTESTSYAGTWLFLFGGIELLIRPVIRLARRVHLQHLRPSADTGHDEGSDF